jgi:hypothetical protein
MINKFIFFPFTHIAQDQQKAILAFFPSFRCLPLCIDFKDNKEMQALLEQGHIHPFFSSQKEVAGVERKLKEYLAWAAIHKGNEGNLKALLKDTPYFTDDTAVSAIKTQINSSGRNFGADSENAKKAVADGEATLENNLLFLKMAHLCDGQNDGINLNLKKIDDIHANLISGLRGLDAGTDEKNIKPAGGQSDPGNLMTRERILAFLACMDGKGGLFQSEGTPFFVTTSPAVFDYLESNCKDVANTLDIDQIKVHENGCENKNEWQHEVYEYLMQAVQRGGCPENDFPTINDGCSLLCRIKLSLFSGSDINSFFNVSGKQIPVCLIQLK